MKILIISETPNTLELYDNFFTTNGFATICYSWLVKALDNIEEINPEIILVNSIDYPRNWKVLIQNAKQVSRKLQHCIVVVPNDIDDDELQKIKTLGVLNIRSDFTQTDEAQKLLSILKPSTIETIVQQSSNNDLILTCTMPETRWEITGNVESYNYPTIVFTPKQEKYLQLFTFGKKFYECTLCENGLPSKIAVQVQGYTNNSIEFCIIK